MQVDLWDRRDAEVTASRVKVPFEIGEKRYAQILGMEPSSYQRDLFEFVEEGEGHGFVWAAAGSGKTSSIVASARLLPSSGNYLFCAFNRVIRDELAERLKGTPVEVRTIHSLGHALVRVYLKQRGLSVTVKHNKTRMIAGGIAKNIETEEMSRIAIRSDLEELVTKARETLTDVTDRVALTRLADHFSIKWRKEFEWAVARGVRESRRIAFTKGIIDFTDMVYLPTVLQEKGRVWKPRFLFDWVFVDEAQDLNTAQRRLVQSVIRDGGRSLWVGDPDQSIYGFSGADTRSMHRIVEEMGAVTLPLSVCYRCPKSHLRRARAIVPTIEAAPGAPEGRFEAQMEKDLPEMVEPGDMIVSRKKAPLLAWVGRLIRSRKSMYVAGREMEGTVVSMVRSVNQGESFSMADFVRRLQGYVARKVDRLIALKAEKEEFDVVRDTAEIVYSVIDTYEPVTFEDLLDKVKMTFQERTGAVCLSTVHQAKGKEAERVFILRPNELPLHWPGQKEWERREERGTESFVCCADAVHIRSDRAGESRDHKHVPGRSVRFVKHRRRPARRLCGASTFRERDDRSHSSRQAKTRNHRLRAHRSKKGERM